MNTFTVKKARKIIGTSSKKLSDEEIEELLSQFYSLAEILADTVGKRFQTDNQRT